MEKFVPFVIELTLDNPQTLWGDAVYPPVWLLRVVDNIVKINNIGSGGWLLLLKIDNQQCTSCARKALKGYDFGPERALSAYEDYAGIDFKNRTVQKACIDKELP